MKSQKTAPARHPDEPIPGRYRFIPFRKSDLLEMCVAGGDLRAGEEAGFRKMATILEAVLHYEFHRRLETIKDSYAPFNPDADTRRANPPDSGERERLQDELVREMTALLDAANYERVTPADLDAALNEESLFKIRLAVDFDDFRDVLFFRRGESIREETLRTLMGLRRRRLRFVNYDRVVIYIRFQDREHFDRQGRGDLPFVPGSTIVKLFHSVPRADLEMLFPNSEVRMKTVDKLAIGVPAAVSGAVVLVTKLGASLALLVSLVAFWLGLSEREVEVSQKHLVAMAAGFATLGAYLFKQFTKFKNRKIRFMKALTDNLYFKNLDNNAGVFFHLVDAAEEEEFKEALLAWVFLHRARGPRTAGQVDGDIEAWLEKGRDCRVDFEIADALAKLARLGLAEQGPDGWRSVSPDTAVSRLDARWDDYFVASQG